MSGSNEFANTMGHSPNQSRNASGIHLSTVPICSRFVEFADHRASETHPAHNHDTLATR